MSTLIRPEISRKNRYWISKNRYYELKYFCLQYNEWLEKLRDGTESDHELNMIKYKKMLVENQCKKAGGRLTRFLFEAVTNGTSYESLNKDGNLDKDTYYDIYRKFFWMLSRERE